MELLSVPARARPSSPRGIVLLIGYLEGGGAERQCYLLARGLRGAGQRVTVVTENARGVARKDYADIGVEVEVLKPAPGGSVAFASKVARTLRSFSRLPAVLRRLRPVVVQAFLPRSNCAACFFRGSAGVPIVIASHRYAGSATWNYDVGQAFEAVLCRRADVNLANSVGVAQHLRRRLRLPAGTIDIVANGVEPLSPETCRRDRTAARRDLELGDEELAIVKVANLWPYKGYQDLIEALARVRDAGVETRAFFIGGDRGFGTVLSAQIAELGLSDTIRFLGERSDVCALLPAFDIYVSASRGEGMSNAVMEAMQHALPIVGSRVAGTPELLDHGAAGCLFEPGDVNGLADAILDLARDPAKRRRLGAAAEVRIREEFSEELMVRRTLEVYARAARARGLPDAAREFSEAAGRIAGAPRQPPASVGNSGIAGIAGTPP